jgi:Mg/Co/Ni transporter MgtE
MFRFSSFLTNFITSFLISFSLEPLIVILNLISISFLSNKIGVVVVVVVVVVFAVVNAKLLSGFAPKLLRKLLFVA